LHDDAIAQVIKPPRGKLIRRGERFEKSLAGETTFAATLTLSVAMSRAIIARTTAKGLPSPREDGYGVPERFAKNDDGSGSDDDAMKE